MNTRDPSPLPLRVRLPFATEEEFIRRFGSNLSPGGIFIPTKALKPEGTQLRFELVLADGTRLLRGGVVVLHALAATPEQRGGMELAFTELDGPSHVVLERVLFARDLRSGRAMVSVGPLLSGRMVTPSQEQRAVELARDAGGAGEQVGAAAPGVGDDLGALQGDAQNASPRDEPDAPPSDAQGAPQGDAQSPPPSDEQFSPSSDAQFAPSSDAQFAPQNDEASASPESDRASPHGARAGQPSKRQDTVRVERRAAPRSDAMSELQRSARAERVEDLARASAQGIGALVARARQQEAVTVLSFCFDHPDAGIGRIDGGRFRHVVPARPPQHSPALRLLARQADAPRVLELAHGLGMHPGAGDDGFADWDDGLGRTDGTTRAAHWLEAIAAGADALSAGVPRRPILALPLHAGHLQRQLWFEAAARVGLENLQLVSSPIAAAVAYSQGRGFARKRLLVLSLSQVGFDAAVVQITGDDVETLSAAGDPYLSTAEFDARMIFGIRQRMRMTGLVAPEPTSEDGRALEAACATARRELEAFDHTTFEVTAHQQDGSRIPFTVESTRAEADAPVHDLVERIVEQVRDVLRDANLSAAGLDDVLVLGRTRQSPLLRRRLSEVLERTLSDADEQPSTLIAQGAALFGESLLRAEQGRPHLQVSEVLSLPVSLAERSGALRRVLERGTRLPVSKTLSLPGVPGVPQAILVYQGGPERADADLLGAAMCTPDMPGDLEVRMRIGRDGRASVELLRPGGGTTPLARTSMTSEALEALLAHAPEGATPVPEGGGLMGGLRRLFRKA